MVVNKKNIFVFFVFFVFCLCLIACTSQTFAYEPLASDFMNWIIAHTDPLTGLPYSHVGDERFDKWTITYDAAVSALAFIASGEIERAKTIIDFYRSNENLWRLGGLVGAVYAPNPKGHPVNWLVWSGENLWMGIASFHLYKQTGEKKYLQFSRKLADFTIGLQNKDEKSLNYNGISLGPKGDSSVAADQHINYDIDEPSFDQVYASEHNIDAYALFNLLFRETNKKKYRKARKGTLDWLKNVAYNQQEHRFNRGARDEVDDAIATDVHSWAISALGPEVLDEFEEGFAQRILDFVQKNCVAVIEYDKPNGEKIIIQGADYTDIETASELGRDPIISPEWTFQLINAYTRMIEHLNNKEVRDYYTQIRSQLLLDMLKLSHRYRKGLAYPYATTAGVPTGHGNITPEEGNLSVIGAAYAILSLYQFDPLVYPEK